MAYNMVKRCAGAFKTSEGSFWWKNFFWGVRTPKIVKKGLRQIAPQNTLNNIFIGQNRVHSIVTYYCHQMK